MSKYLSRKAVHITQFSSKIRARSDDHILDGSATASNEPARKNLRTISLKRLQRIGVDPKEIYHA
jgi:hypothetical protein